MPSLVENIISAESGGDAQASNPNSSAVGAGQFLAGTWLDSLARHRPDITGSREELLALRNDPVLSKEMTTAYAADNAQSLAKAGLPVTDGSIYLSHFAGPGGAVKVLQADPNANAGEILGPAALKANPWLANMTAQGLQAMMAKKAGVSSPTAAAPPAPQQPPAPAIPQQPSPIFAQPAAPQPAPEPPPAYADPSSPPMFAQQQRHQFDPSALRAAIARQQAPIFARTS